MGDPAGIGGETALMAWSRRDEGMPPFFLIDDPGRLKGVAAGLGLDAGLREIEDPQEAASVFAIAVPVLPISLAAEPVPGAPDQANAPAVLQSIKMAAALVMEGRAAAMVTNPIHKAGLYKSGFAYPGHTEFLAALADIETPPVMMLASEDLRVVPVTIHLGLADAIRQLRTKDIAEAGAITETALKRDFGIADPRIAIAGLNPHAGEEGSMGFEERDIIGPAVEVLRARGIHAFGPEPPDTLFTPDARKGFDAAICMYHDQALIPIKALAFDRAVNVTLGLPFVRTSPDHGTAFDIAGKGRARPESLMAALKMAAEMAARRARQDQ